MAKDVFSVPVFLVVFRETLETVIIVSVLLAFLKQTLDGPNRDVVVYKALVKQVSAVLVLTSEIQNHIENPHPTKSSLPMWVLKKIG